MFLYRTLKKFRTPVLINHPWCNLDHPCCIIWTMCVIWTISIFVKQVIKFMQCRVGNISLHITCRTESSVNSFVIYLADITSISIISSGILMEPCSVWCTVTILSSILLLSNFNILVYYVCMYIMFVTSYISTLYNLYL